MSKKFLVYLTAGYPSLKDSMYFIEGISDIVDGIEIGLPFSDPLADGPVIQQASTYALSQGLKLKEIFEAVKSLSKKVSTPLYFMTYYNVVFSQGLDKFCKISSQCSVKGLIVPDCPLDEAGPILDSCRRYDLSWVPFITPTTTDARAKEVFSIADDFVYYVSVTGITGARSVVNKDALKHIDYLKKKFRPKVDILLGFGISSPQTLHSAQKSADGVIVGSAIIKEIDVNKNREANLKKIREKILWMKGS